MEIERLGPLVSHPEIEEWLISQPIDVPLFGVALPIVFDGADDDDTVADFSRAVINFLKLDINDRNLATPYVYTNYRDFVEAVGEDEVGVRIDEPSLVWEHVSPTGIYLRKRAHDNKSYVLIETACEWEQEHGLQLVYREGQTLARVSAIDGHVSYCDAYGLPESENRIGG